MTPKIFITGTTGYVGGDALYALHKAHPEYEYTALVRNSDSGAKIASVYPSVRLVYGTLDDSELITSESSKANIVLHTADSSDHVGAANAIAAGLALSHTVTSPGFWIHLSGTGILTWSDKKHSRLGEALSTVPYDDLEGVSALTSLPDEAFHRNVDKIVLASNTAAVKTAIVCPPTIYGTGRGAGNVYSRQLNVLAKQTLKLGMAPIVGKGLSEWDNVHVTDLSDLFVLLVERAATWTDAQSSDDKEIWGEKGYFFAENGHHVWGELSKTVAGVAKQKGLIDKEATIPLSKDKVFEVGGFEGLSWGLNSRGIAKRASKFLGWKPTGPTLEEAIAEVMDGEARKLGLVKGHGEKVAEASK